MSGTPPFVFVTVGTDHHRIDRWAAERDDPVDVLVQSGTADPPGNVEWTPFLGHGDATAALRRATAVVCHAGPGTVMSCRSIGLIPIVVPRKAGLGEHVDDHQVSFARRMAQYDQVRLAESSSRLAELLDRAIEEPGAFRTAARTGDASAIVLFGHLVERLVRDGATGGSAAPRGNRRASMCRPS
jgi:UDP-N-acetylglucosamine transferase subunit ALG13